MLRRIGVWRCVSGLLLLLAIPVAVRIALDSGIGWDEEKQLEYGRRLLAWYRSGFADRSSFTYMDLYLYGGLFDLPAELLISTGWLPWGPYETRHVLTALLAVTGGVGVWLTANRIAGPRAGLLAAAALVLTPAWVGHGLFNSKDIPFATAVAFVAYASTRIALRPAPLTWGDAAWAGLSIGCALGFRPGGMFLFAFPALAALVRMALDARACSEQSDRLALLRGRVVAATKLLCVAPVSWALMLVAWPWAQVSPVLRPLQAAAVARHFAWGGTMRFDGRIISTDDIPAGYLPTWFRVTLPDFYLLAVACGVVVLAMMRARRPDSSRVSGGVVLVLFVVAPYAGVLITRPVIYDAHRHFLFLIPPLAALAGLAIDRFLSSERLPRAVRLTIAAGLLAGGVLAVHDMRALHPYEYTYFNRLSGGLPRQAERFETDYWGLSYAEAFEWVVHNVRPEGKRRIRVFACNIDGPLSYYRKQWNAKRFIVERRLEAARITIGMLRGECRDLPGTIIHTVERQGVPLAFVRRR